MARFSIRDIEAVTGIKSHTLRIWEQRYGIIKPKRTETNIRYYDDEDLRFILNISILNNYGFKISEIAKMTHRKIEETVMMITEKDHKHSSQIKALISTMLTLDETGFNKVLSTSILQYGLEEAMLNIVFPFLSEVGILWQIGSIHPAHEHFISNLVKQKLFVAIDGQAGKVNPDQKKFLLFLPEGEPHVLGLLFANYLLRVRGHDVVYLGQNLPYDDLSEVLNFYKPDYIFSALTTTLSEGDIQQFIDKLANNWPDTQIILSGKQVLQKDLKLPKNVDVVPGFDSFIEKINKLTPSLVNK